MGKPVFLLVRMFVRFIKIAVIQHYKDANNLVSLALVTPVVLNTTYRGSVIQQKFLNRVGGQSLDPLFYSPTLRQY